jgi:FkbM family methyltransferase
MIPRTKLRINSVVAQLFPDPIARWCARRARGYFHSVSSNHPVHFFAKRLIWATVLRPLVNWRSFATQGQTDLGITYSLQFPDFIQQMIYYFGVWEPSVTRIMQQCLSEGDTFVDVGANIGYNTCLASKLVGSAGHVHAIEASPSIFLTLLNNIALNKAGNIVTYNKAVYDRDTEIRLFKGPPRNIGYSTTSQHRAHRDALTEEACIPAQPLQKIVPATDLYTARLIKIDVEGAEWFVVRGIIDSLDRFDTRTEWLIELNPSEIREQGGDVDTLVDSFKRAGYHLYIVENRYDVRWYIKHSDSYSKLTLHDLLLPAPQFIRTQVDVLFTKQFYR